MYTMTEDINQRYIARIDGSGMPVTCGTCHHGHVGPNHSSRHPMSYGLCLQARAIRRRSTFARAQRRGGEVDYASPLEILLSADGARLYVLCQQSEEVRVLDAASYAVIKNIAVGRVPRGMSFRLTARGSL